MWYSSNGIDQLIAPLLPAFGYCIECGACDGVTGSSAKYFEDLGWIVLCIEPNPLLAESGRKHRKLWRQIACGSGYSRNEAFTIVGKFPYGGYSGFHIGEAERIFNCKDLGETQTVDVEMDSLESILYCSGFPRLDLLTVDAEGHEVDILSGIDLNNWKPKIIVIESWEPQRNEEIIALLKPHGYILDTVKEQDYVYSRKES